MRNASKLKECIAGAAWYEHRKRVWLTKRIHSTWKFLKRCDCWTQTLTSQFICFTGEHLLTPWTRSRTKFTSRFAGTTFRFAVILSRANTTALAARRFSNDWRYFLKEKKGFKSFLPDKYYGVKGQLTDRQTFAFPLQFRDLVCDWLINNRLALSLAHAQNRESFPLRRCFISIYGLKCSPVFARLNSGSVHLSGL